LANAIDFYDRFPGILPQDDILLLLKLMASKNPSKEIAAKIIVDGGYDPCIKFPPNATFWTSNLDCDPGFIPDNIGGYCYMTLPDKANLENGEKYCRNNYDAELILFDRSIEVDGFLNLLTAGKIWLSNSILETKTCFNNLVSTYI